MVSDNHRMNKENIQHPHNSPTIQLENRRNGGKINTPHHRHTYMTLTLLTFYRQFNKKLERGYTSFMDPNLPSL